MFKYNFKLAWCNILRNRSYSLLNILGIALGFASSILIYLWTENEAGIDHQHSDSQRIYTVYSRGIYEGGMDANRNTPAHLPAELKERIPEIEYATGYATSFRLSLKGVTKETFQVGDVTLKMSGTRGSPDFFKVFSFPLLEGSADAALKDLHSISISRKMAEVFFGSPEKAYGQSIRYQNTKDLAVAAVFEDIGPESSLKFDYLINWEAWVATDPIKQAWGHFGTQTYIKLLDGADPRETEVKIRDFLSSYLDFNNDYRVELGLQKFEDQYLYGNFENGKPAGSRIAYVKAFRGVALFILIIAVINFVNLASATATKRAREVGIRKIVGASRILLRTQFMTESFLLTLLGTLLSLALVMIMLPVFNGMTLKSLTFPFRSLEFWIVIAILIVGVGIVSGIYPALILSGIKPVSALKKVVQGNRNSGVVRKGMVVFQFVLSILLVIVTLVVSMQTNFVQNKQLGFDKENLVYIPLEGELISNYSLFRIEASKMPGIKGVDRSSQTPHDMGFSGPFVQWEGKDPNDQTSFTPSSVGYDFVSTMDLELVKGRDFSRERPVDANNFIINEMTEKVLGTDEALGKTISIFGKEGKVVGIVKDFHYSSLHSPIKPLILDIKEDLNFGTAIVRIEEGKTNLALQSLREVYETVNPGYAFSYTFVDNAYEELYQVESTMSSLTQSFAGLAIFISCLGLFGLVTFATELRVKEIGIRKILGATITSLFHLLSREFIALLCVAIVLAVPLGYYLMGLWLEGFAYRIDMNWWLFALACIITLVISYIVIGSRVIKTALVNPIDSLRNE